MEGITTRGTEACEGKKRFFSITQEDANEKAFSPVRSRTDIDIRSIALQILEEALVRDIMIISGELLVSCCFFSHLRDEEKASASIVVVGGANLIGVSCRGWRRWLAMMAGHGRP